MTAAELDSYRRTLLDLRKRHGEDISHLSGEALRTGGGEASGNLSNTPLHLADLGTDNFEQEFTLGLLQNEERLAAEIDAALGRIQQGTYGQCEDCAQGIDKTRLGAVPYARYCIACARQREQATEQG